jgi:transposase
MAPPDSAEPEKIVARLYRVRFDQLSNDGLHRPVRRPTPSARLLDSSNRSQRSRFALLGVVEIPSQVQIHPEIRRVPDVLRKSQCRRGSDATSTIDELVYSRIRHSNAITLQPAYAGWSLRKIELDSIIVESTGGYERRLTEALTKAQLPVILVNPWRVRRFGEGLGVLAKTDPLDARILALFGERARPERRPLPDPRQREMADLVRRRRQLISIIVAEKNRLDTASKAIRRDIQAVVQLLERRVCKLDEKIDAAIDGDDEKAEIRTRLQTVPSVGPGVARTLIVDLPELGHLGRRQICSLVGLAPFAKDSGKKAGVRRIKAGRAAPRSALYLAAMNGARFNPVLKAMYERMLEQGKPKKVALIALARKLLTILNAMVRDGKDWQQMSA